MPCSVNGRSASILANVMKLHALNVFCAWLRKDWLTSEKMYCVAAPSNSSSRCSVSPPVPAPSSSTRSGDARLRFSWRSTERRHAFEAALTKPNVVLCAYQARISAGSSTNSVLRMSDGVCCCSTALNWRATRSMICSSTE